MMATILVILGLVLIVYYVFKKPKNNNFDHININYHINNPPKGKEFSHYKQEYRAGLPWLGGGYYTDFTKPVYKDKFP